MRFFEDSNGNRVSASAASTIEGVEAFERSLVGFEPSAEQILRIADEDRESSIAQLSAGLYLLSGDTSIARKNSKKYFERARALKTHSTNYEISVLKAAMLWFNGRKSESALAFDEILEDYAGSLLDLKWAQTLHFDVGNDKGLLSSAQIIESQFNRNSAFQGMLSFGYEENDYLYEAKKSANCALEIDPHEVWAQHTIAHIFEAEHDTLSGVEQMLCFSNSWERKTSFIATHNWWHICLMLIDAGEISKTLEIFDQVVWNHEKSCAFEQSNAISLLYRLERLGVDVQSRFQEMYDHVLTNVFDQMSPFLDLHSIVLLSRCNFDEASALLERIQEKSRTESLSAGVWGQVVTPMAIGIVQMSSPNRYGAHKHVADALKGISSVGGSHAQKDLFYLLYLDALILSGMNQEAIRLLSKRHKDRPYSYWINSQLRQLQLNA